MPVLFGNFDKKMVVGFDIGGFDTAHAAAR